MKSKALTNSVFLVIGAIIGALVTIFLISSISFSHVPSVTESRSVINIAPSEASEMLNKYQDQWFNKLIVRTSDGDTEFIETFIVQDSIFTQLKDLTARLHPAEKFEGIALNLGRNEFGSTAVVSALIADSRAGEYKHLIPSRDLSPNIQKMYFYDHLNICPNICPTNQPALYDMD